MVQKTLSVKKFGKSSLTLTLDSISETMGKWGIGLASLVGLILICQVCWVVIVNKNIEEYKYYMTSVTLHVIYCLALIVVAVPEGLKLIETVAISYSVRKLNKKECLVKSIYSPEEIARCKDFCTDLSSSLTVSEAYPH
jgi:P-type Ca2+ transporter type 2C